MLALLYVLEFEWWRVNRRNAKRAARAVAVHLAKPRNGDRSDIIYLEKSNPPWRHRLSLKSKDWNNSLSTRILSFARNLHDSILELSKNNWNGTILLSFVFCFAVLRSDYRDYNGIMSRSSRPIIWHLQVNQDCLLFSGRYDHGVPSTYQKLKKVFICGRATCGFASIMFAN